MLIGAAGLFGIFLFLTYYLQQTLGYSPLVTGVAFLPISGGLIVVANLSTIVLMPRFGPKPLVASGMLAASGGAAWLAQLGPHTGYATGVLGPLILAGIGLGMVIAPAINTGTFGVAPQDAGVASATVTVGQMLGGSVGTSLLNTIFASAVASYFTAHLAAARLIGRQALTGLALAHGYDTAFWWIAGIFAGGAVIAGALLRRGPLGQKRTPSPALAGCQRHKPGRAGSRSSDRGFQPRGVAAAGAFLPAQRRPGAGTADRRTAGVRPAGVAGPAAADGLLFGALLFQVTGQQLSVAATRRTLKWARYRWCRAAPRGAAVESGKPGRGVGAELMQDGRRVVGGPLLHDHPARKAVDVHSVPAHPATGGGEPQEIPLLRRLDDVAHSDRVACRHDVLLRRMQVGQRTDETAQHPGDIIDALDCSEGLAVPRHPRR